ncbi:class II glutamine amidotransferase [Zhaonella formicivorans]|uniref:class II glutamine amidotransferase n=2 Tax=Bacteria TaxID=2 RepID=UPI0010F2A2FA|nr:glutamine amidotransferase family protein [Zhaonella formicivorans]
MLQREGEIRIPSGCAISGIMNRQGKVFSGQDIMKSIALMRDRSNGLGGGFAAYGIYPEYKEFYALHIFYENIKAKDETEQYLSTMFRIEDSGKIPTRKVKSITNTPLIWRYFVLPKTDMLAELELDEKELVVQAVMTVNSEFPGAYVFSSGKNMGAFKAVGYPEEVGEFYRLDEYKGYVWTAHGRFPTNTPGWWGGAHPFTLLDWSIVHNGEISSYGANKRYLEMFGYKCMLQTDTEAITYIFDLLLRRHGLPLDVAITAVAAPLWSQISRMEPEKQELVKAIRTVYSPLLINGPFSIILGSSQGFVALNDRLKLRSLVAATKGDFLYVASEESAIREVCPKPEKVWAPRGGEPVIGLLENTGEYTATEALHVISA